MPDPIEVEVVCPHHYHSDSYLSQDCVCCDGYAGSHQHLVRKNVIDATLAPGSLSEAIYRLGLAAERKDIAAEIGDWSDAGLSPWRQARAEYHLALAEVRRLREEEGENG
jgi:hypothetical protein